MTDEAVTREIRELMEARSAFYRMLAALYFQPLSQQQLEAMDLDGAAGALEGVPGVGEGAALLLTLVPAVSQYTHRHAPQETILNSVDASGRYFMRLLRHERRELLYQACLDGKGKLLSCRCLSEGGVNMAAVTLRQIVEHALLSGASSVLLAHNHPSGIALPSASDRQMTLQVRDALATMGIRLTDHIIVADDDFVSMAQSGLLQ